MEKIIHIIGGGLAGSEAAYQVAKRGIKVKLYEMKPKKYSSAHSNENLAEIVCSNSFKSNLHTNACGLLKEELRQMDSLLIKIADQTKVPAGQALAVDREKFSEEVTNAIRENQNIEVIHKEITDFNEFQEDDIIIVATGPLTADLLANKIGDLTGQDKLFFYDAAAPIVTKESVNFEIAFIGDRYGKGEASYINLPMNQEEYEQFYQELIGAEVVELHEFEKREIFEGCMPVEVMAKRGKDTLRFGPLKPVGFTDPRTGKRPYAIVQLRQDNKEGTLYNLVGFQTNLKFGEQKRVFSLIPGLEKAEFVKYGVMHRNTYINSTKLLNESYQLRTNPHIFFAGQITGVEGYVESIMSGLIAGINAANILQGKEKIEIPKETMSGAITKYIVTENDKFQPMNANFGILPELSEKIRDKKMRYEALADRAMKKLKEIKIE
ncbi:MAG TPA: methylenetetrahydrofolate--tRNA-(uracil(54)-C(5))-methyltransferase (FADH(2)-oxidizing) TrmFO [Candidatus Merdicola faecigallinarum]|uniref:Methylenetetrahydrofolate--tRNA-(uracil-5-)-methyltransferase TrmFO n=1 Tax=Candidatus Merdicola faecigallinarum TaxID=2840862 RepID=A0A9D1S8J3_9FIRM|nr:methylenetetrahydrofolate--tRNA-(uracil(54)-C(5))-methyltransferase (FADH(2)-oxidizing) TrmFO [Candidatus Merdicola faecigallinarum]